MTVLMFGWEFPPHISGGLGTACLGLSKALMEQNIRLLFVVPVACGNEAIPLLNASDVLVGEEVLFQDSINGISPSSTAIIPVESTLKPYTTAHESQPVESWNWEFVTESSTVNGAKAGVKFNFTGRYGPSLMDEVRRYADVAAVIASKNRFDAIHAHDWLTFMAGVEAKRVSGKRLVVHVHATEIDRAGEAFVDKRVFEIEKAGMKAADIVIAVSQRTKEIITSKYGIDSDKVRVVHNGVAQPSAHEATFFPKFSDSVVTFMGRVTYQKGPQYFIDAACKVLEHFPDTHFIMAGSGDMLPSMIDYVASKRLSSRIHFTGFLKRQEMQQVWSVTDVYVMPSVSEPFGITPLEAIQAGVPVIVSKQSGVAEVMEHLIKVDFWDTGALADAIINLLNHKVLAESLKENSKTEIESLTWKRAAKKINELYDEIRTTVS